MAMINRRAETIVAASKEVIARLCVPAPAAAAVALGVAEATSWAISAGEVVVGFDALSAADALMMVAGTLKSESNGPVPNDFGRLAARCAASACCFAVAALHDRRTLREAEAQLEQAEAFAALAGAGAPSAVMAAA